MDNMITQYVFVHLDSVIKWLGNPLADRVLGEIERIIKRHPDDIFYVDDTVPEKIARGLDKARPVQVGGAYYGGDTRLKYCVDFQLFALQEAGFEAKIFEEASLPPLNCHNGTYLTIYMEKAKVGRGSMRFYSEVKDYKKWVNVVESLDTTNTKIQYYQDNDGNYFIAALNGENCFAHMFHKNPIFSEISINQLNPTLEKLKNYCPGEVKEPNINTHRWIYAIHAARDDGLTEKIRNLNEQHQKRLVLVPDGHYA